MKMSRPTTVMVGGIVMTSMMGSLMVGWLALNEGSGFVGLLFISGMLIGMAVFCGGAAEALRTPDRHDEGVSSTFAREENGSHSRSR